MNTIRSIYITLGLLITVMSCCAQIQHSKFSNIEEVIINNPKNIVVFIHTEWCGYCKSMENSTFKNSSIINQLNTNFYFISLNAESKKTIKFRNRDFKFIPNGKKTGVNQLAIELAMKGNILSYPTLTVLNEKYEIIFQHASFLNAKQLNKILKKLKTV